MKEARGMTLMVLVLFSWWAVGDALTYSVTPSTMSGGATPAYLTLTFTPTTTMSQGSTITITGSPATLIAASVSPVSVTYSGTGCTLGALTNANRTMIITLGSGCTFAAGTSVTMTISSGIGPNPANGVAMTYSVSISSTIAVSPEASSSDTSGSITTGSFIIAVSTTTPGRQLAWLNVTFLNAVEVSPAASLTVTPRPTSLIQADQAYIKVLVINGTFSSSTTCACSGWTDSSSVLNVMFGSGCTASSVSNLGLAFVSGLGTVPTDGNLGFSVHYEITVTETGTGGSTVEDTSDLCDDTTNPCENDGVCDGGYCTCTDAWTGTFCTQDANVWVNPSTLDGGVTPQTLTLMFMSSKTLVQGSIITLYTKPSYMILPNQDSISVTVTGGVTGSRKCPVWGYTNENSTLYIFLDVGCNYRSISSFALVVSSGLGPNPPTGSRSSYYVTYSQAISDGSISLVPSTLEGGQTAEYVTVEFLTSIRILGSGVITITPTPSTLFRPNVRNVSAHVTYGVVRGHCNLTGWTDALGNLTIKLGTGCNAESVQWFSFVITSGIGVNPSRSSSIGYRVYYQTTRVTSMDGEISVIRSSTTAGERPAYITFTFRFSYQLVAGSAIIITPSPSTMFDSNTQNITVTVNIGGRATNCTATAFTDSQGRMTILLGSGCYIEAQQSFVVVIGPGGLGPNPPINTPISYDVEYQIEQDSFQPCNASAPCLHGGNCTNSRCSCPPGWMGDFCEHPTCTDWDKIYPRHIAIYSGEVPGCGLFDMLKLVTQYDCEVNYECNIMKCNTPAPAYVIEELRRTRC